MILGQFFDQLLPSEPLVFFDGYHFLNQSASPWQNIRRNNERSVVNVVDEIFFAGGIPRQPPEKQLVENNAQRPDVAFAGVPLVLEDLRGHVEGSPHSRFEHLTLVLGVLGEPKVSNFESALGVQNVGWLDISVHDMQLH